MAIYNILLGLFIFFLLSMLNIFILQFGLFKNLHTSKESQVKNLILLPSIANLYVNLFYSFLRDRVFLFYMFV